MCVAVVVVVADVVGVVVVVAGTVQILDWLAAIPSP